MFGENLLTTVNSASWVVVLLLGGAYMIGARPLYRRSFLVALIGLLFTAAYLAEGIVYATTALSILLLLPAMLSPIIFAVMKYELKQTEKRYGAGSTGVTLTFSWLKVYRDL